MKWGVILCKCVSCFCKRISSNSQNSIAVIVIGQAIVLYDYSELSACTYAIKMWKIAHVYVCVHEWLNGIYQRRVYFTPIAHGCEILLLLFFLLVIVIGF